MSSETAPASSHTAAPSKLLLVDDHPVLRQGLAKLIEGEPDLLICGEVESADAALEAIERTQPDMAIVDLSLEGKPGLGLIKEIKDRWPKMLVLVLSMHEESLWAERVLRAGACGYVMKQEKPRELVQRIRRALKGDVALSAAMADTLLRKLVNGRPAVTHGEETLGDREIQVLQLIGQGHTPREIAAMMNISTKTVDAHREHLKRKLNLESVSELLRYATLRFAN